MSRDALTCRQPHNCTCGWCGVDAPAAPPKRDSTVCYLYLITCSKAKGKKYIGITANPAGRWEFHKSLAQDETVKKPLPTAMRKHGVESFNFAVLATGPRWALSNLEAALIAYWRSRVPNGWNVAPGGDFST